MVLPRYKGMHIEDERLYPLLERYLAGETSARDAEIVREWLAEDAAHAQILADLRLIKHVAHDTPPPTSVDADRKSTRLNSSHTVISYAVFCLKKKKKKTTQKTTTQRYTNI